MTALKNGKMISGHGGLQELDEQSRLATTGGDFADTALGLGIATGLAAGLMVATPLGPMIILGGIFATVGTYLWTASL
ncbi:MAG TPA: hypothetical protein VE422_24820 [Terriglobia bacterium]|nr:hypothetical protein [Terriglobia bacterium]